MDEATTQFLLRLEYERWIKENNIDIDAINNAIDDLVLSGRPFLMKKTTPFTITQL